MSYNPQMVLGLTTSYRKYSAVLEFQQPLTELAVEQPSLLKEAGQKYLAEKGTVFTMSDVTVVGFSSHLPSSQHINKEFCLKRAKGT